MDLVFIQDGVIINVKIGNVIQFNVLGVNGWLCWVFDKNGMFELNGVVGGGYLCIIDQVVQVFDVNGVLCVCMGIW